MQTAFIGNWRDLRRDVLIRWHRLTDDDLDMIAGERDALEAHLQARYGSSPGVAAREVGEFCSEIERS
jgi:uncharacterized protein YjbJ (UPF0337 family)